MPFLAVTALAACSGSSDSSESAPKTTDKPAKLAGVWPSKFECSTVTSDDQVSEALGAKAANQYSPADVPNGIARPCAYQILGTPDYYSFDFDCRDNYKKTADALFAQYTKSSEDAVQQYNVTSDAAVKDKKKPEKGPDGKLIDAGVPSAPPDLAVAVEVGSKGLDHHGRGLILIDDDAPCYVRVVGVDPAKRLALAKLVAKQLTFANAPMTPRPFP